MKNMRRIAVVSFALAVVAGGSGRAADQKLASPAAVVSRYSGVTKMAAGGAAAPALRVEIKDIRLVRDSRGVQISAAGFYIAQLRSGVIDTEVAGKKEHRHAGDFWTVNAGESMIVSFPPHSQSAQIQTVTLTP